MPSGDMISIIVDRLNLNEREVGELVEGDKGTLEEGWDAIQTL